MTPWITAVGAFLGALAATLLAQAGVLRNARHTRSEARLDRQREVVAAIIRNGRDWVTMQQVVTPAIAKMDADDMEKFVESGTGRELRTIASNLRLALTNGRLGIRDDPLAAMIEPLSSSVESFAADRNTAVADERAPRNDRLEAARQALARVAAVADQLTQLEAAAARIYPVSVTGKQHTT